MDESGYNPPHRPSSLSGAACEPPPKPFEIVETEGLCAHCEKACARRVVFSTGCYVNDHEVTAEVCVDCLRGAARELLPFAVFVNDMSTEWVIARTVEEVWITRFEHTGESQEENFEAVGEEQAWRPLAESESLGFWCGPDGRPCEVEDDGAEIIERKPSEWVALCGRGFLGSTEQ